ncbi:MAG: hypothetical protein P8171_24310 [Candidatus Thiodiazotropha sp.]
MSWLILFAHAFNPFLLLVSMNQQQEEENTQNIHRFENLFSMVLSSFLIYLVWLGAHFLVMTLAGSAFDYDDFIGVGKGVAYFLPFLLGLAMVVMECGIRPGLRSEKGQVFLHWFRGVFVFFGCYFMFVNYLAWLAS